MRIVAVDGVIILSLKGASFGSARGLASKIQEGMMKPLKNLTVGIIRSLL
jgi:hypothetical protein